MSFENWATLVGVLATLFLGMLNYYNGAIRGRSIGMLESGQYMESVNKSVALANDRALSAEKRAVAAEARANELEDRITALEKKLSYRITFDVILGNNPTIEKVDIHHYPERRSLIMPFEGEDRRSE